MTWTHRRWQKKHCITTDGTLIIVTHRDEVSMAKTKGVSRWDKQRCRFVVSNARTLIINETIEMKSKNEPARRANWHSVRVACRTDVVLIGFLNGLIQSIANDTDRCKRELQ